MKKQGTRERGMSGGAGELLDRRSSASGGVPEAPFFGHLRYEDAGARFALGAGLDRDPHVLPEEQEKTHQPFK